MLDESAQLDEILHVQLGRKCGQFFGLWSGPRDDRPDGYAAVTQ